MFKAKIRGSLLDALERMASESGRDPNELLDELLTTATDGASPPSPGTEAPPMPPRGAPNPNAKTPNARGRAQASHPTLANSPSDPNAPRIGETIASKKRREAGEHEGDTNEASASNDDAPPEKMKGAKPNPLGSFKGWASQGQTSDDADADESKPGFVDPKKKAQDDKKAAALRLRQKHLGYAGKPRTR